eukprot:GILJ01005882.1.p1 GENE.GILJ01005882.1~~GILJ01005882.1.p1  ORF type:complete len:355 (+),score=34.05 GILJ01005882.1:147-1211(+)
MNRLPSFPFSFGFRPTAPARPAQPSESPADAVPNTAPPSPDIRKSYLMKLGIGKAAPVKRLSAGSVEKSNMQAPSPVATPSFEAPEKRERDQRNEDGIAADFSLTFVQPRSHDDIRLSYLKKLSYAKVWVPQSKRPKSHQTVIIFDWDDTLLCTSYLNLRQDDSIPPAVQTQLRSLEIAIINLLSLAESMGSTFIITNAMTGWVEYSASKYLPAITPLLSKVKVISARGAWEERFPGNYHQWKAQAFLEVQKTFDSEIIANLLCLGDSNVEMDAIHLMGKCFSQALIKTVKFRENPTPDELVKQLELVAQKFDKICNSARNLTIRLERKWVPTNNSPPQDSAAPPAPPNPEAGL